MIMKEEQDVNVIISKKALLAEVRKTTKIK